MDSKVYRMHFYIMVARGHNNFKLIGHIIEQTALNFDRSKGQFNPSQLPSLVNNLTFTEAGSERGFV